MSLIHKPEKALENFTLIFSVPPPAIYPLRLSFKALFPSEHPPSKLLTIQFINSVFSLLWQFSK